MAERKEFKAESRRLLDLMINSIYTHKEIFLRELISNASDALDKYYLYALENGKTPEGLNIRIDLDQEKRTLQISDNGIGMSKEELEENLGTIAKSGSLAFKEQLKKQQEAKEEGSQADDVDIIGQFGVGFYSAFMVADEVTVTSRAVNSEEAWCWASNGADGYTMEPAARSDHGTTITLKLKADDDLESYSQYLDSYQIQDLVKRYSDYIRYPIQMEFETQKLIEETKEQETPEYESVKELRQLNSMVPLWKRAKGDISQEEFDRFYQDHFYDFQKPLDTVFFSVEGNVSFTAMLFIPARRPENFYSREYKPGLQLYSRGVLIENNNESLLPDYLRFVKGLVDSQDLSLNISREMLQHDHQLRLIRSRIEKKVLAALASLMKKERKQYEAFWKNFGLDLKFGIYNSMGADKDKLQDLLLFYSSIQEEPVSLAEFVAKLPEGTKDIYYVSGSDPKVMDKLPTVAKLKSKDIPVLFLNDEIDEFVLQTIGTYEEHAFKNASQGDLDLDSEEEKKALQEQSDENKDLLDLMNESLPDVSQVRLSNRLVNDPVMLVAGNGMSFEMERVYKMMAEQSGEEQIPGLQAERILEINPDNPIWAYLRSEYAAGDKERVKDIAAILYDQACLIEGFAIKDPLEYSRKVTELLAGLK